MSLSEGPWKHWKRKPDEQWEPHVIHLVSMDPDNREWWSEAMVKWDGCVHFYQYSNMAGSDHERVIKTEIGKFAGKGIDDPDYLHLCGIMDGEFVASLIELTEIAREWFSAQREYDAEQWRKP